MAPDARINRRVINLKDKRLPHCESGRMSREAAPMGSIPHIFLYLITILFSESIFPLNDMGTGSMESGTSFTASM
jgi:hypothetical protein